DSARVCRAASSQADRTATASLARGDKPRATCFARVARKHSVSYRKQLGVDGHANNCIRAERIQFIHFLLAADSTGNNELPRRELAEPGRNVYRKTAQKPLTVDMGVKKRRRIGL